MIRALKHVALLMTRRTSTAPQIMVYQGPFQRFGHLGPVQQDFNLTGRVESWYPLRQLTARVNGCALLPLRFTRSRRIVEYGDFNADIPITMLAPGENRVVLIATDIAGASASAEATVVRFLRGSYPLPTTIRWSEVTNLEDVGQGTDGKWVISPEGLHTVQIGYDRIFLIGNTTWTDYEATAPITIHRMSGRKDPHSGNVRHVGFCFRWAGHSIPDNHVVDQPKWGMHPRGGVVWLTIRNDLLPPIREFYPGDSEMFQSFYPFAVRFGETFWMKGSCETLEPETTRYSLKVWRKDAVEPADWDFQVVQHSAPALRSGGLALVAHELDVTFGDIDVRALPPLGSELSLH